MQMSDTTLPFITLHPKVYCWCAVRVHSLCLLLVQFMPESLEMIDLPDRALSMYNIKRDFSCCPKWPPTSSLYCTFITVLLTNNLQDLPSLTATLTLIIIITIILFTKPVLRLWFAVLTSRQLTKTIIKFQAWRSRVLGSPFFIC